MDDTNTVKNPVENVQDITFSVEEESAEDIQAAETTDNKNVSIPEENTGEHMEESLNEDAEELARKFKEEQAEIKRDEKQEIKKRKKKRTIRTLRNFIFKVGFIVVGLYLLLTYVFGIYVVHDNNMFPTLKDGDLVITYKLGKYITDQVVAYKVDGHTYFGRLVAKADDVVNITEEAYYFINEQIPYEMVYYETTRNESGGLEYPYTVPQGYFFVMNDMRTNTADSRFFGALPTTQFKGFIVFTCRSRGF